PPGWEGRERELVWGLIFELMESARSARPDIKFCISGYGSGWLKDPDGAYLKKLPSGTIVLKKWGVDGEPTDDPAIPPRLAMRFGPDKPLVIISHEVEEVMPLWMLEADLFAMGLRRYAEGLKGKLGGFSLQGGVGLGRLDRIVSAALNWSPWLDYRSLILNRLSLRYGPEAAAHILDGLRAMEFGLSSFFSDFCYIRSITGGYGRGSEGFATRLWDLLGEEALRDLVSIPRLDLASRAVRRLSEVLVMIERAEDEISLGRRLAERGDADLEDLFHMARFWRGFFGSRLRLAEAVKLSWESAPPELIDGRIKLAFRACGAMAAEIALITSFVPVFGYSDETCRESLLELLAEEKEFLGELDHKRLKEMGLTELVARGEEPEELEITELLNVPNPCDGRTTFIWRLSREAEEAELAIYTTSGRLVRRFRGLEASRGGNELDVRLDLPNGVYIYRLKVRDGDKAVSRTGLLAVLR
ncbi:hypothetical protein DRP77_09765, partial [Candidatus Poribacteria bacterium]